ncbi:hypothetical protein GECvBN5_gp181c [Salmonella phage GEC_vB_N5]|uniref:Uncharacterized protein n=1 Tax=Salmonella phage GEC_vB_N5 TaxID=2777378 RepID=A0A7S9SRK4_9CAUD|nr:hypothetical protein GECvBN5_gp181c [Salmonella phage GEC_vB_N5]
MHGLKMVPLFQRLQKLPTLNLQQQMGMQVLIR